MIMYLYKEPISNAFLDYASMFARDQREKHEKKFVEKQKELEDFKW